MRAALVILLLGVSVTSGEDVTLAWNADQGAAAYNVYYGPSSHAYEHQLSVGNTLMAQVPGLDAGQTYYFAVTAQDALGNESDFSTEVSYAVPEPVVTNIVTVSVPVLSATNLNGPWMPETVFSISYTNPPGTKFFRFGLAITTTNQ